MQFRNVRGFSIIEVLVALGLMTGALALLAYMSNVGFLTRGGVEKRTESYHLATTLISKLYNTSIGDLETICKNKNAFGKVAPDPCFSSSSTVGAKPGLSLESFFDVPIQVTSLQNSGTSESMTISCVHINSCNYILANSLLELKVTYHWHEPIKSSVEQRSISFRRGLR